ncbi:DUF3348 domain-containing protein [Collimonas arenae]|uniref:DUF3348 domain-containing protein n=1 Tax=Collimonas arenae TaxID=279058 RepID=UPI00068B9EEE|nr:DUF3348 domain-containing protein [Collimonas arenae]
MSLRTNFHSSQLIRCLTEMSVVESTELGNEFAEKLGQWIHFTDAIPLSAVHNDGMANLPKLQSAGRDVARDAIGKEFDRIQTNLKNSIMNSCSPGLGKSHISLPVQKLELPIDLSVAYVPYRRFYDAHQHDMEVRIQPLRTNVRDVLVNTSPKLKKLADLDVILERILRERERKLLATVPLLLKKRFEQLFNGHQQVLADTHQTDNPANWMKAGAWLACFCNDMQTLLLAELELRLQPTGGLINALNLETVVDRSRISGK